MIEVMNFFQGMFMFNNLTPVVTLNTAEVNLAVALKGEALEFMEIADREMQNGATTQALSLEETDQNKRRAFAEIAVWHHNRAADKYGKAAARFEEAGRVHVKKMRGFNMKAETMHRNAAKAIAAVNALNELLQQN